MKVATLKIRTPEGIVFSQPLAGPVTRMLAWWIDQLCLQAGLQVAGLILGLLLALSPNLELAAYVLGYFALTLGYGIALEWAWRGQTIGKKLLRLRVVDAEGMRLQFNQIVVRNLLRCVDSLPLFYLVGGAACWWGARCQRLGDLAANTIVVRQPRVAEPDLDQLLAAKFNSLRSFPHLAARLRQHTTAAEADLALQALLRRESFDPAARVALYATLAAHFRAKVEFPADATEGLADEQWLRNVVDVLYRPQPAAETGRAARAT